MTIVGTMHTYKCDHPGCTRHVTVSDDHKDKTRWMFELLFDYCEEHTPHTNRLTTHTDHDQSDGYHHTSPET